MFHRVAGLPGFEPRVIVQIRDGVGIAPRARALVDTGAAITVVRRSFALASGLSQHRIDAGMPVPLTGLGGQCVGRIIICSLELGSGGQRIRLDHATICVAEHLALDYDVVLGQRDALERMVFVQRNQLPQPEHVLVLVAR